MLEDYLDTLRAPGEPGTFTEVPVGLGWADVPLLLLAGAVEGGSSFFRVGGRRNVRFTWEGRLGPTANVARVLLAGVDAGWGEGCLELPPVFEGYLNPLARRGRHAPLALVWGNRQLLAAPPRSLVLVDRGVAFCFPGAPEVRRVPPLLGDPWPRRLKLKKAAPFGTAFPTGEEPRAR